MSEVRVGSHEPALTVLPGKLLAGKLTAARPGSTSSKASVPTLKLTLQYSQNPALLRLGCCGARTAAAGCQMSEVERSRAAVVSQASVGAAVQQCFDRGGAAIADGSMERRDTPGSGRVRVSASFDEIADDLPLAHRVPRGRAGGADRRSMQRLSTPPVLGPDSCAPVDQVACDLGVVAERRSMERGVAFVDLGGTLGEKELIASRYPGRRQERRRVEQLERDVVKVRDRYEQPREVRIVGHDTIISTSSEPIQLPSLVRSRASCSGRGLRLVLRLAQ